MKPKDDERSAAADCSQAPRSTASPEVDAPPRSQARRRLLPLVAKHGPMPDWVRGQIKCPPAMPPESGGEERTAAGPVNR